MAVSSPGRNAHDTALTATCPPKRMVSSRVSRERVMGGPRVPDALQRSSRCCAEPGPYHTLTVIAGLDPAIHLLRTIFFRRRMDARVKPAHDERNAFVTAPALQRTTPGRTARCAASGARASYRLFLIGTVMSSILSSRTGSSTAQASAGSTLTLK